MLDALGVVRYGLEDLWEEFVWLAIMNFLWGLSVLLPALAPLLLGSSPPLLILGAGLVLALPLPIVSGALCFVANQLSRGQIIGWQTFVLGIRRYWAKSLIVAGINLVALFLIATNLQFYAFLEGAWTTFALAAWLVVLVYWLLTQVFWFPMILEMENEKVFLALRNALAMVIVTPAFSLTLGVVMAVLVVLCIGLTIPALVVMAALLLLIANHATRSRLAFARKEPYRPGMDLKKEKGAR